MGGNVLSENVLQKCATSIQNTYVLVLYTCFVHSFSLCMQMFCHAPTFDNPRWRLRPEIVKPSVRNNIFVKFRRLDLHFRGRPIQRTYVRHR